MQAPPEGLLNWFDHAKVHSANGGAQHNDQLQRPLAHSGAGEASTIKQDPNWVNLDAINASLRQFFRRENARSKKS